MKIFIMKKYKNNEWKEKKLASGKNFNSTTLGLSYIYTCTHLIQKYFSSLLSSRLHASKQKEEKEEKGTEKNKMKWKFPLLFFHCCYPPPLKQFFWCVYIYTSTKVESQMNKCYSRTVERLKREKRRKWRKIGGEMVWDGGRTTESGRKSIKFRALSLCRVFYGFISCVCLPCAFVLWMVTLLYIFFLSFILFEDDDII